MRAGKQEGYAETNEWGASWTFASMPLTKDHYRMEGRTEMHNSQDLQKVLELRDAILGGNEKRLKEQREAGKLTARERVEKLADAGSFVELFALVSQNEEGAGVITGYATLEERPVYIFAQDFTVHGGAMGKAQAAKILKLLDMALKTGAPVVALLDSAGVRIDEGAAAMSAYSEIYQKLARMSGVCPIVSVVLGPCIGGAALLTQLADVSIVAEKVGEVMVFGPQVLAAMNGLAVKIEELGGAKVAAGMGACALTAATEDEALSKAKQVLALLPSSNLEDSEIIDSDDMSRLIPAIDAGDVDALVAALMDGGASIELYAAYEPAVRVFMGRMGARSVGVVAASGKLTAGALQKAARFVRFMDCFGIAMVSLINTSGVTVDSVSAQGWLFKAQSQLLFAYAEATAPKLAVVTGDAIGQAYVAMGGKANADVTYAWPGAVISALTPEAAVAVLYAFTVEGLLLRALTWDKTWRILKDATVTNASIFIIMCVACALGQLLLIYNVPDAVSGLLTGVAHNKYLLLTVIIAIMLIAGTFMEALANIIILAPLMFPVIKSAGIDPVHFGIVLITSAALGFLTPPVGVNLFVACGISKMSIEKLSLAVLPFLLAMLLALAVLAVVPKLSLLLLN